MGVMTGGANDPVRSGKNHLKGAINIASRMENRNFISWNRGKIIWIFKKKKIKRYFRLQLRGNREKREREREG